MYCKKPGKSSLFFKGNSPGHKKSQKDKINENKKLKSGFNVVLLTWNMFEISGKLIIWIDKTNSI